MTRAERAAGTRLNTSSSSDTAAEPSARAFQWQSEDRIQCSQSECVSYPTAVTSTLSLNIPVDNATNKTELNAYKVSAALALAHGPARCHHEFKLQALHQLLVDVKCH